MDQSYRDTWHYTVVFSPGLVKVFDFLTKKELTSHTFNQGGTTVCWAPSSVSATAVVKIVLALIALKDNLTTVRPFEGGPEWGSNCYRL